MSLDVRHLLEEALHSDLARGCTAKSGVLDHAGMSMYHDSPDLCSQVCVRESELLRVDRWQAMFGSQSGEWPLG